MATTLLTFRGIADPDWVTPAGLLDSAPDPRVAGCDGLVSIVGPKTAVLVVSWAPGKVPDDSFVAFWAAQAAAAGLAPGVASISERASVTQYEQSKGFKGVPCHIVKKA